MTDSLTWICDQCCSPPESLHLPHLFLAHSLLPTTIGQLMETWSNVTVFLQLNLPQRFNIFLDACWCCKMGVWICELPAIYTLTHIRSGSNCIPYFRPHCDLDSGASKQKGKETKNRKWTVVCWIKTRCNRCPKANPLHSTEDTKERARLSN